MKSKLYLALQAAVCIALTALLCAGAASIYREGSARKAEHPMESVYTPEIVSEKFAPIAPLFFAGVGLLIVGLALGVKDNRADSPARDAELARDLLAARVARPSRAMLAERRAQKALRFAGWGAFAACTLPVLAWLLDPSHLPKDDLEGMFIGLMRVFLPWIGLGLGALAVTSILRERSARREAQAAQARLKEEAAEGSTAVPGRAVPPGEAWLPQAILIAAAIAFIIAGAFNGSARDVLYKAVTICTECVGLG